MDGCLACKSCVGQCPIKVDVPAFRRASSSSTTAATCGRRRTAWSPRSSDCCRWLARDAHALAMRSPRAASVAAMLAQARAWSRCLRSTRSTSGASSRRAACATHRWRRCRPVRRRASKERRHRAGRVHVVLRRGRRARLLRAAAPGSASSPWLAPFKPNGKPQHVLGFLVRSSARPRRTPQCSMRWRQRASPLVGVDPSMTLAYRAEYVKALGEETAPSVALPQEWLASRIDALASNRGR